MSRRDESTAPQDSTRQYYKETLYRPRGDGWQVDYGTVFEDGRKVRLRRNYPSEKAAKEAIDDRANDKANHAVGLSNLKDKDRADVMSARGVLPEGATLTEAARWLGRFTEAQRRGVVDALEILDGHASLPDAAAYFIRHANPAGKIIALDDLVVEYLAAKVKTNKRPSTIADARGKAERFIRGVGVGMVRELNKDMIEEWLDGQGFSPPTKDSYRVAVKTLLNYAVRKGYLTENPAVAIEAADFDQADPEILDVSDVRKLLGWAERDEPGIVAHLSIGFFAGLRSAELQALRWEQVNLEERLITVTPATAKKRRQRHVTISDNLLEWLRPLWQPEGPVPFSRAAFRRARTGAGTPWPRNCMRHSFASFHLVMHGDAKKTSLELGHMDPVILFESYRTIRTPRGRNVTPKLAESYWSIVPQAGVDNVIELNA